MERECAGRPLSELRARVRDARGRRALRRLQRALAADPRAGARALAALCERRLAAQTAEARRQARLFVRQRRLERAGVRLVAGADEVGVGPLAGPLVAAAVILPGRAVLPGLDDSKRLDPEARARLAAAIREQAVGFSVAEVPPELVDRLNVYRAALEALRRAVGALAPPPDHVLVDGRTVPELAVAQTPLPKGDATEAAIAAASILAKVHRDALMCRFDEAYPDYGFARHKGYATAAHREALRRLGPCPIHRRSFIPVSQLRLFA